MSRAIRQPLSYTHANERLVEAIPELGDLYRTERDWWGADAPPPHVVFEDLLDPFVRKALANGDVNTLRRVFDFIERLSSSGDRRLHDLVAVAVCERLSEDPGQVAELRRYMGPRTRGILRRVLKR